MFAAVRQAESNSGGDFEIPSSRGELITVISSFMMSVDGARPQSFGLSATR
jgi:hypothetical protein